MRNLIQPAAQPEFSGSQQKALAVEHGKYGTFEELMIQISKNYFSTARADVCTHKSVVSDHRCAEPFVSQLSLCAE